MNEQTMIWFLKKTRRYRLGYEATTLWMDFYTYLQNQNRACYPQVPYRCLTEFCDLEQEALWTACKELVEAAMMELTVQEGQVCCRLIAERLHCTPATNVG